MHALWQTKFYLLICSSERNYLVRCYIWLWESRSCVDVIPSSRNTSSLETTGDFYTNAHILSDTELRNSLCSNVKKFLIKSLDAIKITTFPLPLLILFIPFLYHLLPFSFILFSWYKKHKNYTLMQMWCFDPCVHCVMFTPGQTYLSPETFAIYGENIRDPFFYFLSDVQYL